MRVAHVITRLIVGGAQENTITSVLGLREKPDCDIILISGPTVGAEGSLEPVVKNAGVPLHLVPELVRPVHPLKDVLAFRRLTQLFRELRPDVVHTHSGKAGILGRLAAHRAGVPILVHHIHGPSFGPWQGALPNLVCTAAERIAGRVTDHFLCSADAMSQLYLQAGIGRPGQYTRLFSGFNLEPFERAENSAALRAQLGLRDTDFVIGKIARLFRLKGHADLIAAAPAILRGCPHARFLLLGDGVLRAKLQAQVHAAGLTKVFVFAGLVPPAEVPRYVGIMDCVVHLSYREALARALPQALAAGKPVVTYDFDGAGEVCLDGKTGYLVRQGDLETFAARVLELASNPALRATLGRCGRNLVHEWFSVERMVQTQYDLYRQLALERGLK